MRRWLLGIATGFLWAPCAGPVLGLILTGAALQGASVGTTLLLLTYAAGAATSLALALLVGGRVFAAMKRSIGAGEWIRRGLGVAVLAAVVAIALGADTGFLTNLSVGSTTALEQGLLEKLRPNKTAMSGPSMTKQAKATGEEAAELPVEDLTPSLDGAQEWLNSAPLTMEGLKGKVVLVDFWTYSCINCLRSIPYVRAWAEKYRDHGLVVIGVHAPEFAFERNVDNVKNAITTLKIGYPVAIDNEYKIWRAFENEYWPAHYFIDANGKVRHHHFGEGGYAEFERDHSEAACRGRQQKCPRGHRRGECLWRGGGFEQGDVDSPETYIGYNRGDHFVSPGGVVQDESHAYAAGEPQLNEWSLVGKWTIGQERAQLNEKDGSIVYRFHARDLHLVLGPSVEDGNDPLPHHHRRQGARRGSHGDGRRCRGQWRRHDATAISARPRSGAGRRSYFEIRFLDPGVQAYAFTFG